jgi:RNA polymerase sigma factor (TIGR02999 family)
MEQPTQGFYQELRSIAYSLIRREYRRHTLSPTDLFHEAYVRLGARMHGLARELRSTKALFIITMRRILIDHARRRLARERALRNCLLNGGKFLESIEISPEGASKASQLVLLEEALILFAKEYPSHAKVVESKYFGGMTIPECAEHLGKSESTIQRRWEFSRAWLNAKIIELGQQ